MTTETETTSACPRCNSTAGMALSSGARLCFECRYEWTGDGAPATITEPPFVPTMTADDVLGPPDSELEARAAEARLDAMVGTLVRLEGGQLGMIRGFPDDDHAEIEIHYESGERETTVVDFNDITATANIPDAAPVVDDETQRQIAGAVATCAGMILQAALETITTEGDRTVVNIPPTGWLPRDTDAWAVVEQGAAYAAAILVYAHELDREIVAGIAADLIDNATTDTKGGTE